MGCGIWFHSDIVPGKNYSCLCCVLQGGIMIDKECMSHDCFKSDLRWNHTLQGDNSLKSVERFDHMMFVCRFQASR